MVLDKVVEGKITAGQLRAQLDQMGSAPVIMHVQRNNETVIIPLYRRATSVCIKHNQETAHGTFDVVRILVDGDKHDGKPVTAAALMCAIHDGDLPVKIASFEQDFCFLIDENVEVSLRNVEGEMTCVIETTDSDDA